MQTHIIDKPDIVQATINEGITLRKAGRLYKGLCPFHIEKTPSFIVYPDTQSCHCFGCNEGGDVIFLIRKLKGYSFPEALSYLGIEGNQDNIPKADKKLELKKDLLRTFRQWETAYYNALCTLYQALKWYQTNIKTIEEAEEFALLYHELPKWDYHMDIILYGDDAAKYELFMEIHNGQF